jgi:hypothetical protein
MHHWTYIGPPLNANATRLNESQYPHQSVAHAAWDRAIALSHAELKGSQKSSTIHQSHTTLVQPCGLVCH